MAGHFTQLVRSNLSRKLMTQPLLALKSWYLDSVRAISRTCSADTSLPWGYFFTIIWYSYCSIWGSNLFRPAPSFLSMPFSAHLLMFLMGTPYSWLSLLIDCALDLYSSTTFCLISRGQFLQGPLIQRFQCRQLVRLGFSFMLQGQNIRLRLTIYLFGWLQLLWSSQQNSSGSSLLIVDTPSAGGTSSRLESSLTLKPSSEPPCSLPKPTYFLMDCLSARLRSSICCPISTYSCLTMLSGAPWGCTLGSLVSSLSPSMASWISLRAPFSLRQMRQCSAKAGRDSWSIIWVSLSKLKQISRWMVSAGCPLSSVFMYNQYQYLGMRSSVSYQNCPGARLYNSIDRK